MVGLRERSRRLHDLVILATQAILALVVAVVVPWDRASAMSQNTEAVYSGGVLKPDRDLGLREQQRVRLIVEPLDEVPEDRETALARLKAGIARMQFFSKGPLPKREELHDALEFWRFMTRSRASLKLESIEVP
jgi:predicted DNA-binding antitoxin AbrB/MazE fold protein